MYFQKRNCELQHRKEKKHLLNAMRLMLFVFVFSPLMLFAQTKNIQGTVKDSTGTPIPGVSFHIKGGKPIGITDGTGNFKAVVPDGAILVFSGMSFDNTELQVGAASSYNVLLRSKETGLNEVVVVGYGVQKKVNMTGSVASIGSKQLDARPVTNVSSALGGLAAGVSVVQGSGQPGLDGATIRVRGTGTLNNASALVVIDGVIGTMDAVNPSDIASISILKDAAAASIYGAQAANGVILITTKKGTKGKPQFNYTGIFSQATPNNKPKFVTDYVRHMELFNEGATNIGQAAPYQQSNIDLWKAAKQDPNKLNDFGIPNYVVYPNTDWGKTIFENNLIQNHNFQVTGGSDNVLYNLSARYLGNPGVMHNTGIKRYEMRANVEVKATDFLTLGTQTFASVQNRDKGNVGNLFNFLRQTTPGLYPMYDGKLGAPTSSDESAGLNNLLGYLYGTGGTTQESRISSTLYSNIHFLKHFTVESRFNYQVRGTDSTDYTIPLDRWNFATNTIAAPAALPINLSTGQGESKDYSYSMDQILRYSNQWRDHSLNAMVGYNEYYYKYFNFGATMTGLLDATITNIGTGTTMSSIGGTAFDRSMRSFFGRLNYIYRDKYMFEANMRRDASSRFGANNRWGNFPSFSAGWRISEEQFAKQFSHLFQDVKLRASWGKLGNDAAGVYDWQATYGRSSYSYGGNQTSAMAQYKIANPDLRWESTAQTDIGLDFSTFDRHLSVELDLYNRQTSGILTTVPLPLTAGSVVAPTVNGPSVNNRGIEISLNWQGGKGDFRYSIGGNFSYNRNQITQYKGALVEGWSTVNGNKVYNSNIGAVASSASAVNPNVEEHMIGEYYLRQLYHGNGSYKNADGTVNINGGPTSGMIRTAADLQWVKDMQAAGYTFSPVNATGKSQLYYGDFIFADLNGDGVYGNSYDRKFTGTNKDPKFIFGFNTNLAYKNFDLSMSIQGAMGLQFYWNAEGYDNSIVRTGNGIAQRIADDHYYFNDANPSDPRNNINGHFPRLKFNGDAINNTPSVFWLYNANYVKLKNIQIGYTLPADVMKRVHLHNCRVFLSGENLLTITKWEGIDPELGQDIGYPTMKQVAVGITLGL